MALGSQALRAAGATKPAFPDQLPAGLPTQW